LPSISFYLTYGGFGLYQIIALQDANHQRSRAQTHTRQIIPTSWKYYGKMGMHNSKGGSISLTKILAFSFLWYLTGNPFLAILILLIVFYVLDRRFVRIMPYIFRPLQLGSRAKRLKQDLSANPHNTSVKLDLARNLIERKKYQEALPYLEQTTSVMEDSADVHYELGLCHLKLGDLAKGESLMLKAIEFNPRVKYGEPYLRLGEALAGFNPAKAVAYLEQFRELHTSSCEAYYRLGQLYQQLGRTDDAKRAFQDTLDIYRGLPRYSRRQQRRWALLARLK
jgi:tetratricopeptide (TPR) repeat protein